MKILNTLLISLLAYSASAQVGIGTSTPTVPLDIEAADAAIDINNTAGDGDPAINFQLSGITTFSLGIDDGDADKFKIGTTSIGTNTRLTIDAAGYVGIGTDEPTVPLHIKGGGVAAGDYQFFIENGNYNKGIQFQYKNGFNDFPQSKIWTSGVVWDTKLHFSTANGTNDGDTELYTALTIDDTQRIGIGTTSPTEKLHVVGNICYTGTSASCSDSRYKKDLNKIGNALEMISNFDGYTYKFKVDEFPENKFDSTQQVGFIAQELREVLPQVVLENDSGYLSVDYSKVTPLLLMAIKEQQAIIESQKQAIETIKAEASSAKIISTETAQKLASLEAKLNALLLLNSKGAVLTAEN